MSSHDTRDFTAETGNSIYQGVLMTAGVIESSMALKGFGGKKISPELQLSDFVRLGVAVMVSRFGLDYMYRRYYNM